MHFYQSSTGRRPFRRQFTHLVRTECAVDAHIVILNFYVVIYRWLYHCIIRCITIKYTLLIKFSVYAVAAIAAALLSSAATATDQRWPITARLHSGRGSRRYSTIHLDAPKLWIHIWYMVKNQIHQSLKPQPIFID